MGGVDFNRRPQVWETAASPHWGNSCILKEGFFIESRLANDVTTAMLLETPDHLLNFYIP